MRRGPTAMLLLPLAQLFRAIVCLRRLGYRKNLLRSHRLPVPVIVVGNIFVGGTGKTPLVLWLVEALKSMGLRPGIVTRGYRGRATSWPQTVTADSDPSLVGDEPVLLAQRGNCPVMAGPERVISGRGLIETHGCDCIVSDDGLQHYALQRDLELVVIDRTRGLGNGLMLPAGPLREPPGRLRSVDMLLANGGPSALTDHFFTLALENTVALDGSGETRLLSDFAGERVHAVCGIGNPQRFFDALAEQGLQVIPHPFADHHPYQPADIRFGDELPVLMTEKDAVKCRTFARPYHWVVPARTVLEHGTRRALQECLNRRVLN